MPESLIEQEFYTSWTASTEETLIPLDDLRKALKVNLHLQDYAFAPRIIGVDPAYAAKGDRAVIIQRQGRYVHKPHVFQGIDPMALASRVAQIIESWKADYVFVDAGRGEAVWSRLFQLGYESITLPVDFGGAPASSRYANKKMEMWDRAKNFICNPTHPPQLPESEELVRDLSAPLFDRNEKHQLVLETKKALKKRGFASTDCGDAFVLTFAEDVDKTIDPLLEQEVQRAGLTRRGIADLERAYSRLKQVDQGDTYDPLGFMEHQGQQQPAPEHTSWW
jgi:hypothetical protein